MLWFKQKKQKQAMQCEHDNQSSIEVVEMKSKVHQSAAQSKRDIDKLNKLLKANGITLRIHIATGGGHRGK